MGDFFAQMRLSGDGGGSGPGPKSSTGPGIIRQFINWLFGGKKKAGTIKEFGPLERVPMSYGQTRLFGLIRNANVNANGESALEQYRAWRDNPSYNAGESWLDRFARNVNSSHMEILRDEGSGGGLMWGGYGRLSNVAGAAEVVEVAVPNGNFYSVAFETVLSDDMYPGVSLYMHFKTANAALETGMSPEVMSELGIVIPRSAAGSILGKSPTNWVWHHDIGEGVMQLVPKSQHPNVPGGIFWNTLHPTGKGGMSIWGGGYK